MKKLIFLSLMLICAFTVSAQNYSSPGIPSGTNSTTPTFRIKPATPDSIAQIWLGIGGNKFYRMSTGMDDIIFSVVNFKGAGTTSSKLDLNNSIHVRDTGYFGNNVFISDTTNTANNLLKVFRLVGGKGITGRFGVSIHGGASMATISQSDTVNTHSLYVLPWLSQPVFSIDNSITLHRIPVIDTFVGATLDTVTHTLTVTGGGGTVITGNGVSGDGSSGTPVILGGGLNQNTTITTGATNIFQVSSTSGLNIATLQLQSGILQNIISRSGHGAAFSTYSVSGSDPLSQLGYEDNLGTGFKTISFGIVNKGAFLLDSKTNLGILFASDYSTNQRANLNSAASVKTVKLLIDSATATLATGVSSAFGRAGAVVAATNDYTFAQIGSKPTTLSGYGITDAVPSSRTITINGTAFDLSADRSWTVGSTLTPVSGETPTGLMNGSNVTFTSAHTPIAGSLNIIYNGLILQPTVDYTFSGTTATLVLTGHLSGAPVSTDYLLFNYQY